MLKANNVTKSYNAGKKVALKDFSIEVPKGSIYGLLGPNGAGKTTFIRIVNQILAPDYGEIYLDSEKLRPEHISSIGYMPEERGLYKNMTLGDQILYFGELKGLSRSQALSQAKFWFERLDIEQWWKKKLSELSKGMAQKIQFVVTVLHEPKLLILDEPFSGFDPVNAGLIKDQILYLREQGTTIILSTHRMESVEELCDSVALIHQSEKILDGKVYEVREKFKQNMFSVSLTEVGAEEWAHFKNAFPLSNEKTIPGGVEFDLPGEKDQNHLISELLKVGNLRKFDEKIPSMNEVFIKAVSEPVLSKD